MKYKLLLVLLMFSIAARAATPLGIGLISVNFNERTTLSFFKNKGDLKPVKEVQFFNDKKINSWNIINLAQQKSWLNPETLNLAYYSFSFRCLNVEENWLSVIVNNETGKSLWLKKTSTLKFVTWEDFLKNMFGVTLVHQQKIRIKPTVDSTILKSIGSNCFSIKTMKGDWIEIVPNEACSDQKISKPLKSGWIKWRNGNILLIDYFLTC